MTFTTAAADLARARAILSVATFATAVPDGEPLAPGAAQYLIVTAEAAAGRLEELSSTSAAVGDFNAPIVARDGAALLRQRAKKLREML